MKTVYILGVNQRMALIGTLKVIHTGYQELFPPAEQCLRLLCELMHTSQSFSGAGYLGTHDHNKLKQENQKPAAITTNLLSFPVTPNTAFTFHLLLQRETSMDLFQLSLHGQPANVCLQVGAIHHANAEHYEGNVLWFRAHQAPPSPTCTWRFVGGGGVLLLVLKDDFTEWFRRSTPIFCTKHT